MSAPTDSASGVGESVELPHEIRDAFGEAPVREPLMGPESVSITRRRGLAGVELWNVRSSKRKWTVYHEVYAFCAVDRWLETEGPQSWWYRRRTYSMNDDSIMMIEPGELHVTKRSPCSDFHVLLIEPEVLAAMFGDSPGKAPFHFREGQVTDRALVQQFGALARFMEAPVESALERSRSRASRGEGGRVGGRALDPLELDERLLRFFEHAIKSGAERSRRHPTICQTSVRLAREYIHANFPRKIRLADLAALGGLAPSHFAKSFRQEVGLPPGQYLRTVRLGWALTLLRTGLPPAWTAIAVGFYSQAEMTRALSEELGFTPGYYKHATPSVLESPAL